MKTKIVVIDENILGYIQPQIPEWVGILQTSVLRGATHSWQDGPLHIGPENARLRKVRLATAADFVAFNVTDSYTIRPDEYEFAA